MDHDPYCPAPRDWWRTCICDVIAQVRDAERDQARQAVAAVPWQSSMLGATVMRAEVVAALDARP